MNKKYIPGIIIVEGSHDASHLSSIYNTCFVITNGYDIPQKEINFIKALKDDAQIIVLTDNDEAGYKIRERINMVRDKLIDVVVSAPINKKKKGIAECDIEDLRNALDKYSKNYDEKYDIDLYKLGLTGANDSKQLREYISNKFNLGICNKNNMVKRLHLLGITYEELEKEINNAKSH